MSIIRRQEKYLYNSYHPSRGSWNRYGESGGRIFSNHNHNGLSTSEYSTNFDGNISAHHTGSNELDNSINIDVICSQNYKSSEGETWSCEYDEEQVGSFSNNTKFRSFRYKKRGVYRNSDINQRNNYSYDSYQQKPYRRYEENKQTFGFHQRFHNQTSDSDGKRMYNARESYSNFGSESYSCKNYGSQNWEDDYETVDMDISDSENNYNRHQKRKSTRYDNVPYKKKCYEHNVKIQHETLKLKHSDSSDITDDDYVGIGRTDVRRNSVSSTSREYCQSKRNSVLEKTLLPKINTDSEMKKDSINAESKGGCSMKKQLSPSTKTSFENPNKPVTNSATIKKNAVKPANNNLKNSNLKYVEIQPEASITKEIGSNRSSSEDPSNLENKSFNSPKSSNQRKIENKNSASSLEKSVCNKTRKECSFDSDKERSEHSKTPLKKGQPPGSIKSDAIRKSQENVKQLEDVMKSPDNAQKPNRNIIEVSTESKKSEKLLPSDDVQKKNKSITEKVSESKKSEKLPSSSSSSGDTEKQSKNVIEVPSASSSSSVDTQKQSKKVIEVPSEPKKSEKLPPPATTPDNTPKQHKNLEIVSESKKPENLLHPKNIHRGTLSQSKNVIEVSSEPKKPEKLPPPATTPDNTPKQHKKLEISSESKKPEKLPHPKNIHCGTLSQSKSVIEVPSEPKKLEKLLPPATTPDNTPKKHKNLEISSESKKPEKLLPPKSSSQSQTAKTQIKEKLNCGDSKKKTNPVKKERALSLDGQSSQVSGDKKLKLSHRKSTGSEQVKEMPEKVTETKSNNMDQDISDSVINDILADLFTQRYIVVDDTAVKNKQSKKSIVAEVDTAVKSKPSSTSTTNQTPTVEKKISKPKEKVAKKIENKVKTKDSKDDKVVKKKDETGLSGKLTPSKSINKSTDSNSKAKDDTKVKKRKIECENPKPSTLSNSNANANKSTPNQKFINYESSKACEKNAFTKETTIPLNGLNTKSNEPVQKSPKISEVQESEPTINNEVKTKRVMEVKTSGLSEEVIKPARRITQRRGKSCDARSIRQMDYLETLNLRPSTRSKSVEPREYISFTRITRSKSPFYGLCSGLPPPTRSRSRSRSSSASKSLEDRQENNCPKKNKSDRILKASDEVKVYRPFLIDMDHRKRVGGYSPRDDDEEVAMHMANSTSSSCMIQHREIDPRDPRKNQFAKQKPVKNGKELIKLKDFVREQLEQSCKPVIDIKDNGNPKKKLKRKAPNVNTSSKGETKKCAPSKKVTVPLEEIEKFFPLAETNKNCIRLNVSNGTEERAITIQRADILRIPENKVEEANVLITDSVEKAQVSNIPGHFHKATANVITIQEANQSEKVVDLTLDDPRQEQSESDIPSLNNINKLTEELLEMCGDEESVVKPESSNSLNGLLNILESPVQRRDNQATSETVETIENNTTAPYTITIRPLVPVQSDEEAQNIIIEIPDFPITESIQMISPNTSEIVTTNCVITQPSNGISTDFERQSQIDAAQKSLEVSSNAKETNLIEAQKNSSRITTPDIASLNLNLSTIPIENASNRNEILSSNSGTVAINKNAIELPKPGSIVSNESNQGCLASNLIQNSSMASNISTLETHLLSSTNKRRLPNKNVQTGSTWTPPNSTALIPPPMSTAPPTLVENQNLPVVQQLQHVVEKHGRRLSQDNLARRFSEVPPNRIAPCNHHTHSTTNSNVYKDFLSNNVYYILKYQCLVDLSQHLFPTYVNSLTETSSRRYLDSATQIFFGKVMCTIEKDMRRYYNAVKLKDLNFTKFLVDLDIELARSGQKLFWKWNLEFLCRLLCRSDTSGIILDTCYQNFISELKKYYNAYVSKCRNEQRTSQNNVAEKTSRPSNISVVPLATLQDPALCNPNLSISTSRIQKSSSDQHQHKQSIQTSNNNTVIFPVSSKTLQTSSSAKQRSSSDQQQQLQLTQASNNTIIFPAPSKSLQTSSSVTRRSSPDQQQLIQSIQRSNNTVFLPTTVQTSISKTQRPSSDQHQHIQSIQRGNSLASSTSSNQTVTNQTCRMTPQQFQLFLQQIEKYKEIVLLLKRQITSSMSNHYIGGNVSGRPAHCKPTQGSAIQGVSNLEHLLEQRCNQYKHNRQQVNLQRLLTGKKSQKDYSQNLHNMINARLSTLSGGSLSQEPAQQRPPAYPLHLTTQYQQNKAAPLRREINELLNSFTAPQQQQSRFNLSPQNNVTEISSRERIFSGFMTNVENASLINAGVVLQPQSQVQVPRKEVAQNSTESHNLNAPELNVTLELNIIGTPNKNAQQQVTQNTNTQTSCTIPTQQQLSSNSINLHNRSVSAQEQMTSCILDNQVQHRSVIATQNEDVSSDNNQTSDTNRNSPSLLLPKEEVNAEVANESQGRVNDEFIDFENYLTNTHGENWDDDIEIFWPENYVVAPLAEEVKNEDGIQVEVMEEEDPIPRTLSNDSGIGSPIDIVLPSQVQLPCSLYEGRFCFCGKHAVYVCTCKLQMYCSEACQMSDWQRHSPTHRPEHR